MILFFSFPAFLVLSGWLFLHFWTVGGTPINLEVLGQANFFGFLIIMGGALALLSRFLLVKFLTQPLQKLSLKDHQFHRDGNIPAAKIEDWNSPFQSIQELVENHNQMLEDFQHLQIHYEGLLNTLNEAVFLFDLEGQINRVNFVGAMLLGRPTTELIGQGIEVMLTEESWETHRNWWEKRRFTGLPREAYLKNKGGFQIPIILVAATLIDETGKATGFLVTASDVSQQKAMENELRAAKAELEERVEQRVKQLKEAHHALETAYEDLQSLDRMKDSFLATISHELRTPLSSILGYAEIMVDMELPSEQVTKFGKIILSESERLTDLINDLLDHSALTSGRLKMEWRDIRLSQVLEQAQQAVSGLLRERGIQIQCNELDVPLQADPKRLVQVMINLIGNAIMFSPPGGVIQLKIETKGENLQIAVLDQGPGVPEEQLVTIFEAFRQHRPQDQKIKGTGLGLAICKQILTQHGGDVWAKAGPGGNFYLQIPLGKDQ